MHEHTAQAKLSGKAAGMLPTGTAIGHKHASADVMTTVQRHLANRLCHAFHSNGQNALSNKLNAVLQTFGQLSE